MDQNDGTKKYTWYVRDAQGNVMAIYGSEGSDADLSTLGLHLNERHIYGTSSLGMYTGTVDVDNGPAATADSNGIRYWRGSRQYSLSNHLGNVLATVSDRKLGVDQNSDGLIDYYDADIRTAQDYYAFGMQMPGRVYTAPSASGYRYGFNGKENDNDVKGIGNQQDYGMRIYDPRLGRFLSVDPLAPKYPELTPYQFASNRPIDGIDLDGLEFFKKDNTNYILDYRPVLKAPDLATAVGNSITNVANFFSNATTGSLMETSKGLNNYLAGGYKEPSRDPVQDFIDGTNDAFRYVKGTPLKQQLNDLGNAATDLKNYEIPFQMWLTYKIADPKVSFISSTGEDIVTKRMELAGDFYQKAGFKETDIPYHMEGIDFSKGVQTVTLKKGTLLQQWVGERGVGDYFTTLENGADKNLGLPNYDMRNLKSFVLDKDVKVLKSTAADYKANAGGGTQFFSTELKNNITQK